MKIQIAQINDSKKQSDGTEEKLDKSKLIAVLEEMKNKETKE